MLTSKRIRGRKEGSTKKGDDRERKKELEQKRRKSRSWKKKKRRGRKAEGEGARPRESEIGSNKEERRANQRIGTKMKRKEGKYRKTLEKSGKNRDSFESEKELERL